MNAEEKMPRKAKEKIEETLEPVAKEKKTSTKKIEAKKNTTKIASKATSSKVASKTRTKKTTNKTTTKKVATKASTTKAKARRSPRKKPATAITEYYDLPYRYNQTIVKILAQMPTVLFVYWDISDQDKNHFQKQYGDDFFQKTKPYLIVINEDKNYQFEVEINDYANSWYLSIPDSNCKYQVLLVRKPIEQKNENVVVSIASSNEMKTQNNHILFDHLGKTVFFRNTKTNKVIEKNMTNLNFMNCIGKIYNIYDFYQQIYHDELNGTELSTQLNSSQFRSQS